MCSVASSSKNVHCIALLHCLSCLKDLLIKIQQVLLISPMKFYIIDTLVNNFRRLSKIFFVCVIERVCIETLILSVLTSVCFSKVALTSCGRRELTKLENTGN